MEFTSPLLLMSKLIIPKHPTNLVKRPRLYWNHDNFIFISGPAGYGKTTLIIDWCLSQNIPTAWYTLDETDNSPKQFLLYLVETLSIALHKKQALIELKTYCKSATHLQNEKTLTLIINTLIEMNEPLVLVLDDFHFITSKEVHQIISFLLDYLPS